MSGTTPRAGLGISTLCGGMDLGNSPLFLKYIYNDWAESMLILPWLASSVIKFCSWVLSEEKLMLVAEFVGKLEF